ncbi:MAG: hypothetical protein ACI35R_02265 [Bacillus sp. (in: firmicutes)]
METRRVVIHTGKSVDNERLMVISIFEPGINKQQIKIENRYSKKHEVLVSNGDSYRYKG